MVVIAAAFLFVLIAGCTKSGSQLASQINGKWKLVSDNTYQGVGILNHSMLYTGQPGDYFDFRADGNLYTRENSSFDTLHYQIVSDTTIIVESFGLTLNGVPETSHITFTRQNATIAAPVVTTPGGVFGRNVQLVR